MRREGKGWKSWRDWALEVDCTDDEGIEVLIGQGMRWDVYPADEEY